MEEEKRVISKNGSSGIVAIVVFFVLLFVFSKWGPSIPFSVASQQKGEPFIVSGQGKVSVTPDIAKLSFGIQESGTSLKSLQASVNQKSKSLTESFKNLGIKDEDIKTTSYSVYPQYDYTSSSSRINGYQVSTTYEIKVRDFDVVNDVLNAGTAAGANVVGGINFEVNEDTQKEKLNEARKLAVSDAKEKATGLANVSGITLGKIINISESQDGVGRPYPYLMSVDKAVGSGPAVPEADIKPGETEINVTVSLSYEVR